MSALLSEQFARLLDTLPADQPWEALEASGYLDLLRPEADGGAGLRLEDLFPLALEAGRRPALPDVVETMIARLVEPAAQGLAGLDAALARRPALAPVAAAATAAQMAGAMETLLDMTLAYAGERQQFGRPIARFQAVQHQIAVAAEEVAAARIAAQWALVGYPTDISARRAAAAKIRAGEAAEQVCAIAHAVHGAIGVSQEHPLHRHVGRLRAWRLSHGGESAWSRKLGEWALGEAGDFASLARSL